MRLFLFVLVFALGCSSGGESPVAAAKSAIPAASSTPSGAPVDSASADEPPAPASSGVLPGGGEAAPDDGNKGKRRKFGDAAVFVDGQPRGVLRVLELPQKLPRRDATLVDGRVVARWRVFEYLQILGVDVAKLKALHVLGGRGRTAVIPGDEIRRLEKELLFSFTRGATGGKPRFHWPPGIQSNTTIDVVGALCAYVEKDPPRYDKKLRALFAADGTKFEGIPYASAEDLPKGTRVYDDGKYLGAVKKKLLPDALLAVGSTVDNPRFSLEKYLTSRGLDPSRAKAVDFVDGDAIAFRLDPEVWKNIKDRAAFSVGTGSRGRATLFVSDPPPGLPAELLMSSILVHGKVAPPLPAERLTPKDRAGSREPQVDSEMP